MLLLDGYILEGNRLKSVLILVFGCIIMGFLALISSKTLSFFESSVCIIGMIGCFFFALLLRNTP